MEEIQSIVVCGFPKSGTTWLTRLLAEAIGCPSAGSFFDSTMPLSQSIEGLDRISNFKVYKTHKDPFFVLEKISKENIIYITRDIRDIVVSSFHFWKEKDMLSAYNKVKNWKEHIYIWLSFGIFFVKYEDLLKDTKTECSKILSHLRIKRTEKEITTAIENQMFEKRKQEFIQEKNEAKAFLLYKGKVGTYKEEINEKDQDFILKDNFDTMKLLGYIN